MILRTFPVRRLTPPTVQACRLLPVTAHRNEDLWVLSGDDQQEDLALCRDLWAGMMLREHFGFILKEFLNLSKLINISCMSKTLHRFYYVKQHLQNSVHVHPACLTRLYDCAGGVLIPPYKQWLQSETIKLLVLVLKFDSSQIIRQKSICYFLAVPTCEKDIVLRNINVIFYV